LMWKRINRNNTFKDPKELERVQNLLNMLPSKLLLEGFVRLEKLRRDNPEHANNDIITTMQRMVLEALMNQNPGATQQSLLDPNQNKLLTQVQDSVNKESQISGTKKKNNSMYNPLQTRPAGPLGN